MNNDYELKKLRFIIDDEENENERFREDFNDKLRKNAKNRIMWILEEKEKRGQFLPEELFEI